MDNNVKRDCALDYYKGIQTFCDYLNYRLGNKRVEEKNFLNEDKKFIDYAMVACLIPFLIKNKEMFVKKNSQGILESNFITNIIEESFTYKILKKEKMVYFIKAINLLKVQLSF